MEYSGGWFRKKSTSNGELFDCRWKFKIIDDEYWLKIDDWENFIETPIKNIDIQIPRKKVILCTTSYIPFLDTKYTYNEFMSKLNEEFKGNRFKDLLVNVINKYIDYILKYYHKFLWFNYQSIKCGNSVEHYNKCLENINNLYSLLNNPNGIHEQRYEDRLSSRIFPNDILDMLFAIDPNNNAKKEITPEMYGTMREIIEKLNENQDIILNNDNLNSNKTDANNYYTDAINKFNAFYYSVYAKNVIDSFFAELPKDLPYEKDKNNFTYRLENGTLSKAVSNKAFELLVPNLERDYQSKGLDNGLDNGLNDLGAKSGDIPYDMSVAADSTPVVPVPFDKLGVSGDNVDYNSSDPDISDPDIGVITGGDKVIDPDKVGGGSGEIISLIIIVVVILVILILIYIILVEIGIFKDNTDKKQTWQYKYSIH